MKSDVKCTLSQPKLGQEYRVFLRMLTSVCANFCCSKTSFLGIKSTISVLQNPISVKKVSSLVPIFTQNHLQSALVFRVSHKPYNMIHRCWNEHLAYFQATKDMSWQNEKTYSKFTCSWSPFELLAAALAKLRILDVTPGISRPLLAKRKSPNKIELSQSKANSLHIFDMCFVYCSIVPKHLKWERSLTFETTDTIHSSISNWSHEDWHISKKLSKR